MTRRRGREMAGVGRGETTGTASQGDTAHADDTAHLQLLQRPREHDDEEVEDEPRVAKDVQAHVHELQAQLHGEDGQEDLVGRLEGQLRLGILVDEVERGDPHHEGVDDDEEDHEHLNLVVVDEVAARLADPVVAAQPRIVVVPATQRLYHAMFPVLALSFRRRRCFGPTGFSVAVLVLVHVRSVNGHVDGCL